MTTLLGKTLLSLSLFFLQGSNALITPDSVQKAFTSAKLVPDVISNFKPSTVLNVLFVQKDSGEATLVGPGSQLDIPVVTPRPDFFLTYSDASLINQKFVIAMVDPDAPTPQNTSVSQVRHFLGGDFVLSTTATSGTSLLVNTSAAISNYLSPAPPAGSDPHRYTLLIFKQPDDFASKAAPLVNATTPLLNFNLSSFIDATGLGQPIGGNFWLTGPANSTAKPSGNSTEAALDTSDVKKLFDDFKVVPDVVPTFDPKALLGVAFPGADGILTHVPIPGANFTTSQVKQAPEFFLQASDLSPFQNRKITIIMVDPDAPTPQNRSVSEVRHFLGIDFTIGGPSNATTIVKLTNSSAALSEFRSPNPPNGSDPHRYALFAFLQPQNSTNFGEEAVKFINTTNILGFNLSTFVGQAGLGEPIAGTFFLVGPNSTNGAAGGAGGSGGQKPGAATTHSSSMAALTAILAAMVISLI